MSLHGEVEFHLRDPNILDRAQFAIDDAGEVVVRKFLAEAYRLEEAMGRQGGFGAPYNFSWKIGKPLEVSGTEPTSDQRAVLLHRLRPFLLQNEPHYFHTVRGIVARGTQSPELREWLTQTKLRFTCKHSQQQFQCAVGDLLLNSERALDGWLNGFEYHRDEEKALTLIKAHDPLPVDSSRPIFIMMLQEKATAVQHLGWLVNRMIAISDAGIGEADT